MESPDIPDLNELPKQHQFSVELSDAKRLYLALHQVFEQEPRFVIGISHSEDELFSTIDVEGSRFLGDLEPSINVRLSYQNPSYQYWPIQQIEQLQRLLTDTYGYNSVDHQTEKDYHSLTVKDYHTGKQYKLNLGYEDERTAWKRQVEASDQALRYAQSNPDSYVQLVAPDYEKALNHLKNSPHPIAMESRIEIKPIDTKAMQAENLLPLKIDKKANSPEEIKAFRTRAEKWTKFIEDAVNAMAKVKGIPQSGKLTLLPPQDLPQV